MSRLKKIAVSGFFWQTFGLLGQRGAAFIASIVLARFLDPKDFGLVGLALAIISFAELLRVGGIVQAFISYQGDEEEAKHTVFWLVWISGVTYFAIMVLGAPYVAAWFHAPAIAPILRVLAISELLDSFRMVPFAMLLRQYRFAEKSIAEGVPMFIAMPAAIITAALLPPGERVWALVVLYLTKYFASSALYLYFYRHFPTRKFSPSIAKDLSKPALPILASNVPSSAIDSLSKLVLGVKVDVAAVGVYNLATSITTPATFVTHAANWTLFPILANHIGEPEKLRDYIKRALKSVGLVSAGLLMLIYVIAPDLIPFVFSKKWQSLVVPTQWLCLAIICRNYSLIATNAMMAVKRATYSAVLWWIALGITLGLLYFGQMPKNSADTPSMLFALACLVSMIITMGFAVRSFELPALDVIQTAAVAAFPPAFAASAVWLIYRSGILQDSPIARMSLATVVYAILFLPLAGKSLGGKWYSLFTPKGIREMIKRS